MRKNGVECASTGGLRIIRMSQRAINGEYVYFVTANVKDRRWYFVYPDRAEKLGQAIQTSCEMKRFELMGYCILPNHIHLLVRKMKVGEINDQRTLGSMRWRKNESPRENSKANNVPPPLERRLPSRRVQESMRWKVVVNDGPTNRYLFPERRLPSRRALEKNHTLSDLMHSIKSTFSQTLRQGPFWQHRSNFRIVESEEYLANVVEYIRSNYTKMDLAEMYGRPPFVFINDDAISKAT